MRELVDCIKYGSLYFNSINSIGRKHKCCSRSYRNIMGDKLLPNFGAKFNTCEVSHFSLPKCRVEMASKYSVEMYQVNEDVRALNDAFGNLNTRKNTSVHLECF